MTAPADASVQVVEVNGIGLFTRRIGVGPDVIVLHGGPGAHHDYLLPQYDRLATARRLRYYDQRGGGRSPVDRDTPVGWREHVADLDALLTYWSLERVPILGYSWGALLAVLFAIEHPSRVSHLALVSPGAVTREGRAAFSLRFAERMQHPDVQRARDDLKVSGLRDADPEAYRRRAFDLSVAGYFKNFTRAKDMTPFRVTSRTQQEVWDSLAEFDVHQHLRGLNVPGLVIHGTHDPVPIETARESARLLRADFVEFADSGHVPHVEEPDRFVSVLDAFLPAS